MAGARRVAGGSGAGAPSDRARARERGQSEGAGPGSSKRNIKEIGKRWWGADASRSGHGEPGVTPGRHRPTATAYGGGPYRLASTAQWGPSQQARTPLNTTILSAPTA